MEKNVKDRQKEKYPQLFQPVTIGDKVVKNRFCFPPVGLEMDAVGDTGCIIEQRARQYLQIAEGGAGFITMGYTAVRKNGRGRKGQLGLWSDHQIQPFRRLTDQLHGYGATVLVQLHHSGAKVPEEIEKDRISASEIEEFHAREMTVKEIHELKDDFVAAAVRAKKAGFDGVELHAAHCYLLSQFSSPLYNHRKDEFGGSARNRIRLHTDIIRGIHEMCGTDFIVGARIGGNDPAYEDGITNAKILEAAGCDYLSISFGLDAIHYNMNTLYWRPTPWPAGFRGNTVVYSAGLIKKEVNIPVIAVRSICTAERGEWLLKNGHADIIAYARPMLTNPDFVTRISKGVEPETECMDCQCCQWFLDPDKCPVRGKQP